MNDTIGRRADDVAAHFAELAREGRDHCVSPCPVCDERDRSAAAFDSLAEDLEGSRRKLAETARAAGFEDAAGIREWIEGAEQAGDEERT